jgi:hypothetical protein
MQRTAVDEDQPQRGLPDVVLGDGEIKQHLLRIVRWGGERIGQGGVGDGGLIINELTTDLALLGDLGDGLGPGQRVEGDLLPLLGPHRLGGTTVGDRLLHRPSGRRRISHVCFLLETGGS